MSSEIQTSSPSQGDVPLHIPEAVQSFPLNMDMTARETGEGNLRTASELREFTLN